MSAAAVIALLQFAGPLIQWVMKQVAIAKRDVAWTAEETAQREALEAQYLSSDAWQPDAKA